jgi:hypothetical protein
MRLANSDHESRPWRIAEIAPDFRLEDVWALPAQGGAEDFETLLEVIASLDPAHGESAATRVLFSIRYRVGGWFGWDKAARELAIPGNAETTLSARLPLDLRNTATDLDRSSYGFRPLYRTDDEWAAELSNRTVHAVMHLAWVENGKGRYQGQMGVYLERQARTADRVITGPHSRRNHHSAHMPSEPSGRGRDLNVASFVRLRRLPCISRRWGRRFDVLGARCVPELPRLGIKGVRLEIHHVWIVEVAVFLFDRDQQTVMRPADDSRFAGAMLVAISPAQFSHLAHRHSIRAQRAPVDQ